MLYRFKSQATEDVVMMEGNARQLLEIIGRPSGPKGILPADQIPAAITALEAAIRADGEHNRHNHDAFATEGHDDDAERQHISLHQRATPFIHMLQRAHAEGKDVVWGV